MADESAPFTKDDALLAVARCAHKARHWQKQYFATRSQEALIESKRAEKNLDGALVCLATFYPKRAPAPAGSSAEPSHMRAEPC
jgi:hypothetical protein